jgi:hypothetical protein
VRINKHGLYVELIEGDSNVWFWHFIPWHFYSHSTLWFFDNMTELKLMATELPEAKMVLEYLDMFDDPRIPESEKDYDRFHIS